MEPSASAEKAMMSGHILVVDDTIANLSLLSNMLKDKGYRIRPVTSGALALKMVERDPPELILLDINMPEMNGYEVCERLKADRRYSEIPIIFISALSETLDKVKAFSCGGVDYITKPFHFEEVNARVEAHLKLRHYQLYLEDLVKDQVKEISDSQISTIFALSKLAESRDAHTGKHLERVRIFCRILAERLSAASPCRTLMDKDFVRNITNASPLHDVGKVAIPDHILLKPGKLTDEEFEIMKTHTLIGAQTLGEAATLYPGNRFVNMGVIIARSHHERWDGKGYPDGLCGDAIPLAARIMAVADVYDALSSVRPYKTAHSFEECRRIITEGSGTRFDPVVVEAFSAVNEEFRAIRNRMA